MTPFRAVLAAVRFTLATLAMAVFTAVCFFFLLSLWGLLFAPWIHLRSASPVMVVSLVLASVASALLWRGVYRRWLHRRAALQPGSTDGSS